MNHTSNIRRLALYAMLGDWAVVACLLLVLLTISPAVIDKFSTRS